MESYCLKRQGSFTTPIVIALNQEVITLGRSEIPELKQAPNVSRSHAMFLRSCVGQWFVKDMNSMNGVFLNSKRIGSGLYSIHVGDIIGLGSTSGDSDKDYVFIMCNNNTLPLLSSSTVGDRKDHCAESSDLVGETSASNCAENNVVLAFKLVDRKRNDLPVFHANNVSDNIFGVQINKEVVEKEPEKSNEKSKNNHVNKTVNKEKENSESTRDNLCDDDLLNIAQNVNNSAIHPLFVDSRNFSDKNALTDYSRKSSNSLTETLPPDVKNHEHDDFSEGPNSSLRPSGSVSLNTAAEGEKLCSHRSLQNENCDLKQFSITKELKVVLKKYGDIVVETYDIERCNAENDSDSSGSVVIIPHKHYGHRLRINSPFPSDESEELHVAQSHEKFDYIGFSSSAESRAHTGKLRNVSNENTESEINEDTENDSDCSGSDLIISRKQHSRRLRINSSSSSDESEVPHIVQSHEKYDYIGFSTSVESRPHAEKMCKVSNEHIETKIDEYDHRRTAENDSDCSGSVVIIPRKQHGRRLRINSSSSSDESEVRHVAQSHEKFDYIGFSTSVESRTHTEKLRKVSNEHTESDIQEGDHMRTAENDSDSSDSDLIIPRKQHGHRLRINSSSDESEVSHVAHSYEKFEHIGFSSSGKSRDQYGRPHKILNEHAENAIQEDDHNEQLTPEVKSCATINITSALNTTEASSMCYTQEYEIIVISSDDDDYDYANNPIPVKIRTESMENEDLSNSEWHYVSNSQDVYEHYVTDEDPFGSDIENFPESVHCRDPVLNSSAVRTDVTNYHKHVDGERELEDLQWEHAVETRRRTNEEELSDMSENIENITKFLNDAGNNKSFPEKAFNDLHRRQKEKTLGKTLLTEAMPMQYRSRSKRGREEWFKDQYDDDKPTKNKVVSKQGKTQKDVENNSVNNTASSAVKHKSSRSKRSGAVTKCRRRKYNKSSSLRDQMKSKHITIPFHPDPSAPVAAPSCPTAKHEKNISFPVKRKLPAVSDEISTGSVKKRRVVVKRKERFNSRMSFFTEDVVAANTDLQNVDSLRSQKKSEHLTKKSHGKVPSFGSDYNKGIEVPSQEKTTTGDPSVLKISHVPKHNAQTLASPHIHSESSLVSQCSNPQFQTASRHVPTRNSSASQVPSVHQSMSGFGISAANSMDACSRMTSMSHVATIDFSPSGSSAVHTHLAFGSSVPVASMSTYNKTDPKLQVKISASNSSASQVPSPTKHIEVPEVSVSCSSASQAPEPRFRGGIPSASVFTSQTPDPGFQKFPAENSSTSQHADPRAQVKVSPAGLSTTQISDPRLHAKTLNSPEFPLQSYRNSVSHSFAKTADTSSVVRAPNVGVVVPQKSSQPMCKLTVKLDSETFIVNILSWIPVWLKEQQSMNVPPPLIDWNKIQPLKLCYQSLDDYALSFYNLLLVEMWQSLFQAWKEKKPNSDFTFVVTNYSESGEVLNLECMSLLSGSMSHRLVEGTLLIINLRLAENRVSELFGYINYCKFRTVSEIAELHTELKKLPEAKEQNPQFCQFKLQVKSKNLTPCLNKRMKGCALSYISVTRRIVNSLLSLESSPLVKDILCPQEKNCTISNTVHPSMHILKRYNKAQASAIMAISDEMRKVYSVPRILLLQGPPGTGKTHVIVGIIENLLTRKHEKIKILVTAPSNAAADEIGRRLIALRRSQSHSNVTPLNFVRVGIPDQIHSDVKPFSLNSLVHATFIETWNRHSENMKATLSHVETKINDLKAEMESLMLQNMTHPIIQEKERELSMQERRARHCANEIEILKNKTVKHSDPSVYKTKLDTLKNADVILSTLSSCRQSVLENSFGKKSDIHFTCCIIDEASQCTEPEALQPLTYGMCKLLLVGDHQQLPATVRSRVAKDNQLEKSLFERIHLYFHETLGRSPVYMLTEQYRMHSEICSFPSSHFYSHKLKAAPELNLKYESFPLKPYIFLNVAYSKESNVQKSKTNVLEAEIVISLCISLVKICPQNCSVGVIAPYRGQKRIYETAFSKHSSCRNIEVNTVDSFQGREKDLVVISCVRSHSQDESIGFLSSQKRLNVAITRAAKCLIICGNAASLEEQPGWTELIRDATSRDLLIPVTSVNDIHFLLRDIQKKMI